MRYRPSRRYYLFYYLLGILSLISLILLYPILNFHSFLFLILFTFFLFQYPEVSRQIEYYEIDKNGVLLKRGILRKKIKMIPFSQINSVNLKKGIIGRLLNFGNIEISSSKGTIEMKGIVYPEEIYDLIKHRSKGGGKYLKIEKEDEEKEEKSHLFFRMFG